MIPRKLAVKILELASYHPVVVTSEPRQSRKTTLWQGASPRIYDQKINLLSLGNDALIIDRGKQLDAIEIKSSSTVNSSFFKNLNTFASLKQNKNREHSITKQLVYGGEASQQRSDARLMSWRDVSSLTTKVKQSLV